jgi:membrane-bound lytic murein transglycosylase D
MPEELIYLAMVESGFNVEAHSAREARGIWQLVADTARRYGLRVDETVDERLDAEKSTDAALTYLSYLYNRFGSWYLAAAAYNTGENRVARIMTEATGSEKGTDADYYRIWEQLPGETRDFVPAMIAAARIGKSGGLPKTPAASR